MEPQFSVDALFNATYEELRRIASSVSRNDPCVTLNPTALVHEAWLKMAASRELGARSPSHFKRIAARAMRQLLVEAARRRKADKRGNGRALVTFTESLEHASDADEEQLMALDSALEELTQLSPRQAAVVETRFFGGLSVEEIAEALSVSEGTVRRDWRVARSWLARELRRSR